MANKALIFDLDGVIVDSKAQHQAAWMKLGEDLGIPVTEEFFLATFGLPNSGIVPKLVGRNVTPDELSELANKKENYYREAIAGNVTALPGALELAKTVKAAGWKTALGTSAPKGNVRLILKELEAENLFDAVSAEGDYHQGKPHPDVFFAAAEKVGAGSGTSIVIEDAVHGLEAAISANMACIAVTTTAPRSELLDADITVDSLEELTLEILEGLLT